MKIDMHPILIATLLASGLFFMSCSGDHPEGQTAKEIPVAVTVATPGSLVNNRILASGQIESQQTAVISTRVMGFITNIHVKPGDQVKKGQHLASISDADIVAKKFQAQAMLEESEASLKDAQKDYERFAELYKQQSASAKEFENATLHYNSVKSRTEAARQMKKEAEAMLAYTNLTAPFNGVITQKKLSAGSMASPGMPILIMEGQGGYKATVSVSEADIASVKAGLKAEVMIKSSGKVIKGNVAEVSPSSQSNGGQYLISIDIPETETNGLYAGMYVNVAFTLDKPNNSDNIILVPTSSLVYNDQLTGLYTISQSERALLRWVKVGRTYGDNIEVLSGLRPDEEFILNSEGKLYNGAPVKIELNVASRLNNH